MMNCGYDPDPSLHYDLPPIAPQLWHAYHIAGEQLVVGALAALLHRLRTGEGQDVSCAMHEAVSKNTELDLMSWVMRRAAPTGNSAFNRSRVAAGSSKSDASVFTAWI